MGFDDFMDFNGDGEVSGAEMFMGMSFAANMGYVLAEDGRRIAEEEAAKKRRRQEVRDLLYGCDDDDDDDDDEW